jgi:hypothetical protein
MLNNILKSESRMDIHWNAGNAGTNMIGNLPSYRTVWYHPHEIANIISLARFIKKGYQVSYNSKLGNTFTVYKPEGGG